jgi:hypothetical protein
MPVELADLVSSWRTAVVTSEIQNGVIGDEAALPALAEAARQAMVPNLARTTTPGCSPASTSRR